MQVNAIKSLSRILHRICTSFESISTQSVRSVRWRFPKKNQRIPALVPYRATRATPFGGRVLLGSFYFWNIFKKRDEKEETPEDKLIMTIKRSILCVQRGEHNKAEQMLHLALRMAQDLQHKDGVTYIYDVMANLALEMGDFEKAEKLFVSVMQRLLGDGFKETHIKMLHISSKIAHMAGLQGNLEKARQGFEWTLQKLEEKLSLQGIEEELEDLRELWGMTKNWYGQTLLELDKITEAKQCFLSAWEVFNEYHQELNEDALMLLNNLGVVCMRLGEVTVAEEYLQKAITLSKDIPDFVETNVFRANLGLVYLQQGLLQKATEICTLSWRLSKKAHSDRALEQADYCLEQIKKLSNPPTKTKNTK